MTNATSVVTTSRGRTAVVALVAVGVTTALTQHGRGQTFDDPYVYYRYALHIGHGQGWDYNLHQGSTATAFTSPLYVLLLACGVVLHIGPLTASRAIFVAAIAGTATVTYVNLRDWNHQTAGIIAGTFFITNPLIYITRGMETSLYLFAAAAALTAYARHRDATCGVFLGLLFLVRADGAVLAVTVLIVMAISRRRPPVRTGVVALVTIAPWLVYAQCRFGTIVPSILAGTIVGGHYGLFAPSFFAGIRQIPDAYARAVSGALLLAALVGSWALIANRRGIQWVTPLIISTVAQVALYCAADVPAYPWYFAPGVYTLCVIAALGVERIVRNRPAALAAGIAVAVVAVVSVKDIPAGLPAPRNVYPTVAAWLRSHSPTNATVAASEIGVLGYYTNKPMVDYLGMFNVPAATHLNREALVRWVHRDQPDYWMVIRPPLVDELPVLGQPWFPKVFTPVYANRYVILYRRMAPAPAVG